MPTDRERKSDSEAGEVERQAGPRKRTKTASDMLLAGTSLSLRTLTSPLAFHCFHDSTIGKRMSFIGEIHWTRSNKEDGFATLDLDEEAWVKVVIKRGSCLYRHVSQIDEACTSGDLVLLRDVVRLPGTKVPTPSTKHDHKATDAVPPAIVFDHESAYINITREGLNTDFDEVRYANKMLDEAAYPSCPSIAPAIKRALPASRSRISSTSLGENTTVKVKVESHKSK